MSLSAKDEEQLLEWFEEKEKNIPESDGYYKYRDLIFSEVLTKLSDYFSVLKMEWKSRHHLSEEDCVSIIHDGLLASVSNFKTAYKSRNRITKFITYLTNVLKNLAMDYARKNHIRYAGKGLTRKQRKMGRIPSSLYVSLDTILGASQQDYEAENRSRDRQFIAPLFKFIEEKEDVLDSQITHKLLVQQLMDKLSSNDRYMLQSIMDGYNLSDIAKRLELTTPGIKYRLKRISKKFEDIKQELWASKKAS
jgi:RNA polymerase sigma factor (sigma-70 family)